MIWTLRFGKDRTPGLPINGLGRDHSTNSYPYVTEKNVNIKWKKELLLLTFDDPRILLLISLINLIFNFNNLIFWRSKYNWELDSEKLS